MGSLVFLFVGIGIVSGILLTIGIVCKMYVKSNSLGDDIGEDADFLKPGSEIFHGFMDDRVMVFDNTYNGR